MNRRRGEYGIDAPYVPGVFLAVAVVCIVVGIVLEALGLPGDSTGSALLVIGVVCGLIAGCYLYTTRAGKFACWERVFDQLDLDGDEQVLDLGCGRGAVLLALAKRLPRGRAVGIDLWKSADQLGNAVEVTRRNAAREGVSDRVQLDTGDLTALPYPDLSFDLVVSSLAIHNITDADGRARAVGEAVRVLRPGGRIVVADIRAVREYAAALAALGMNDVGRRGLGWRFWYGGPFMATSLVTATRPAAVRE